MASVSLLQTGKPSISAQKVALRRAAHQILDRPLVFVDPLAVEITGDKTLLTASEAGQPFDLESRYIRAFMAARSRYAEDKLAEAVQRGVTQYVVLGAGLDTFAYRNPFPESKLRVFEVDHSATQVWKRQRLVAAGIPIPPGLTFVPVDFERLALAECLSDAGLEKQRPTYFSWLGVTPYLTRASFDDTLDFIGKMPPGSGVTFDYAVPRASLTVFEQAALDRYSERLAEYGEPFQLFLEPDPLLAAVHSRGFRDVEDLATAEINTRYFSNRTDGLRVFGGFAHLLNATL